jgi:hypothetical protein
MDDRQMLPINIKTAPSTCGDFILPVQVIKKPVDTANIVRSPEGAASRKPETEAESSLTAWKYNGALNITVFIPSCEKKLENTRFDRGGLESIVKGITGR